MNPFVRLALGETRHARADVGDNLGGKQLKPRKEVSGSRFWYGLGCSFLHYLGNDFTCFINQRISPIQFLFQPIGIPVTGVDLKQSLP